jgi:hypothetical protein
MHKRHRFDTRAAFEMCDINSDGSVTLQEVSFFSLNRLATIILIRDGVLRKQRRLAAADEQI